jgi:dTDP-4-dehydrorhamnose reductase
MDFNSKGKLMKIGITGASGMLGTALIDELIHKHSIFATSRSTGFKKKGVQWQCFDLTNSEKLHKCLISTNPDVIIHCAAVVNVEECENNEELIKKLHVDSTKTLANYLNKNKKQLIYISTDSVFDGEKIGKYKELDDVKPLNAYAKTKLLGEMPVLLMDTGLVLRTNIIGWNVFGKNSFAEWMLKGLIESEPLNLFSDVMFTPIHVSDLSQMISRMIDLKLSGLYHCASIDSLSKYDFGIKMAEIFNFPIDNISKISIKDANFTANRPNNMALCSAKLNSVIKCKSTSYDAIKLMKNQYDNGWLSRIKGTKLESDYNFWRDK